MVAPYLAALGVALFVGLASAGTVLGITNMVISTNESHKEAEEQKDIILAELEQSRINAAVAIQNMVEQKQDFRKAVEETDVTKQAIDQTVLSQQLEMKSLESQTAYLVSEAEKTKLTREFNDIWISKKKPPLNIYYILGLFTLLLALII